MGGRFARFAARAASLAGHYLAFVLAAVVVLAWAVSGPLFGFSDTWQLVINTGTTIVTFLMHAEPRLPLIHGSHRWPMTAPAVARARSATIG